MRSRAADVGLQRWRMVEVGPSWRAGWRIIHSELTPDRTFRTARVVMKERLEAKVDRWPKAAQVVDGGEERGWTSMAGDGEMEAKKARGLPQETPSGQTPTKEWSKRGLLRYLKVPGVHR